MANFIIDVPVPSMGATVSELIVISLKANPGDRVTKGQKIAELESDKSIFDYEAPADGTVIALPVKAGDVLQSGALFLRLETADASLRHLETRRTEDGGRKTEDGGRRAEDGGRRMEQQSSMSAGSPSSVLRPLVWTPRATKLAQEAGLDPTTITGIEATGPGGRVSGDDVSRHLAGRKS